MTKKFSFSMLAVLISVAFIVGMFYIYESEVKTGKDEVKRLSVLVDAYKQSPDLYWVKNSDLEMVGLSKTFEQSLLEPYGLEKSDYIGRDDYEVWSKGAATLYQNTDLAVLECFCPIISHETVIHQTDTFNFTWTKYPYVSPLGDTGVAGRASFDF